MDQDPGDQSRPQPGPASRWRAVAAVVAGVALVALLVGRATGAVGGNSDIFADDTPLEPGTTSSSATPSDTPSAEESSPTGLPTTTKRRDRPRKQPRLPEGVATDVPGGVELAQRVRDLLGSPPEVAEPTAFRLASLNVLGASHTSAGGNKPRYASGSSRMPGTLQLLQSLDVDVVGLQELEIVQYRALKRISGDRYGVYPGPRLGRGPIRNSVAWRQDIWKVVDARTIPIPYFRGNRVPMPYVLLKHRASGQAVWFINIHNPTSNKHRGDNERWRDLATRMETTLANRLNRRTSIPVVLMGDFNERQEAFCRVTGAGLVAANGGRPGRPCAPPADAGIDWIFGTRDLDFSGYTRVDTLKNRGLTDHPVLVTDVRVG